MCEETGHMSSSHWGTVPPTASETVGGSPVLSSTNTDVTETNHQQGSSSASKLSLGSFEIHSPPLGDSLSFYYDTTATSPSNPSVLPHYLDLLGKGTVEDPSGPSPYSYPASYYNGAYTVASSLIRITHRTPTPIRVLATQMIYRYSAEIQSTIRLPKTLLCSPCPPSSLPPFLRNPSTTLGSPIPFPSRRPPRVTPALPSSLARGPPSSLPSPLPISPRRTLRAPPLERPCLRAHCRHTPPQCIRVLRPPRIRIPAIVSIPWRTRERILRRMVSCILLRVMSHILLRVKQPIPLLPRMARTLLPVMPPIPQ